jgi:hypothetical protein
MLQGLRRKIGRYAPGGGVKEAPEEDKLLPLVENAAPFEVAAWTFTKQDRALRRLETQLTQMLEQMQVDLEKPRFFYIQFLSCCN